MRRDDDARSGPRARAAAGASAGVPARVPARVPVLLTAMATAMAMAAMLATAPAAAADAAAGRQKAQACAQCHGIEGLSKVPDTPHLAGQPEIYLVAQLRQFRSGRRVHEVMNLMAKPLSDADIDNLAAWYASQAVVLKKAP